MFEDIGELEKEVQAFRENILASSELVKSIEKLTVETAAQARDFRAASKDLLARLDEQTAELKQSAEHTLSVQVAQLTASNQSFLDAAAAKIDGFAVQAVRQTEQLRAASGELASKMEVQTAELRQSAEQILAAQITRLTENSQAQLSAAIEKMADAQKAYVERMDVAENALKTREDALNSKYESVLAKLEAANLEETVRLCQKIRKSIHIEFGILLAGICAALTFVVLHSF